MNGQHQLIASIDTMAQLRDYADREFTAAEPDADMPPRHDRLGFPGRLPGRVACHAIHETTCRMNMATALPTRQSRGPVKALMPIAGQPARARNVAAVLLGSRVLTKMLSDRNMTVFALPQQVLALLPARYGAATLDDLYEAVGTGELAASTVVRYLLDREEG